MEDIIYDHYVAIDWAATNMAIARLTKRSNQIKAFDVPADVNELKVYLKNLKGLKVLTLEETTTSQWLYTELKSHVDRLVICDPHRNKLLSEGPKTDKIDAAKLVQLLKAGLVKEVYHSTDKYINLRRFVTGYENLVKSGVRLQAQRYSLLRFSGNSGYERKGIRLDSKDEQFVLDALERQIRSYEQEKQCYET